MFIRNLLDDEAGFLVLAKFGLGHGQKGVLVGEYVHGWDQFLLNT
jgi:hypothetical protein